MNCYRKPWSFLGLALLGTSGLVVLLNNCSKAEPPEGAPIELSSEERATASELTFSVPEGWVEEKPSSSMRRLQFRLSGPEPLKGDAEVAVFSGIGGSVEQNVARWIGQFDAAAPPQVNKRSVNNFPVTFVDVSGTFRDGMMSGTALPREGFRMLAAVIETGDAPWFVKLVGPQDTVEKWRTSFTSFVESVR